MAGEEYWVVLYKAIADFGDLMTKAAEAKAAMDALNKSVSDANAAQLAGEEKLATARAAEVSALKQEASQVGVTADAYKEYNVQALYGGRSDMQSHLSDMQRELTYEELLNRQRWLGFTTPQQAYAWRQNEYNQRLLMNRAEWAGLLRLRYSGSVPPVPSAGDVCLPGSQHSAPGARVCLQGGGCCC